MARSGGKMLVTGGYGFVGRHLVRKLLSGTEGVVIIDDASNGDKDSVRMDNCTFMKGLGSISEPIRYEEDIRNEHVVSKIIKENDIVHCVHLAALISVNDSIRNPHRTLSVNVDGTLSVLRACITNQVQSFILASSSAVYGDTRMTLIREDSPPRPISPYGASKVAGEALVSAYASKIKNAFCLRFFNIYGCYQRSEYSGVISRFAERLRRGLPLEIFGNGSQTRDFVHISDVVNAIILAKNYRLTHPCYTINIGTGKAVSVNTLAKNMLKIFNARSTSTIFKAPEDGSVLHSCPDISNAKRILDYNAEVPLKNGLTNMFLLEGGH